MVKDCQYLFRILLKSVLGIEEHEENSFAREVNYSKYELENYQQYNHNTIGESLSQKKFDNVIKERRRKFSPNKS